jgi:hypothetical protein
VDSTIISNSLLLDSIISADCIGDFVNDTTIINATNYPVNLVDEGVLFITGDFPTDGGLNRFIPNAKTAYYYKPA